MKKLLLLIAVACTAIVGKAQCSWSGNTAPNGMPLISQTTDPAINQTVLLEANNIYLCFAVAPTIYYYDDFNGDNAFSSPNGYVVLGVNLIQHECANVFTDCNALPIIMAHEFGHSYAFLNHIAFGTSKKNELYADFLAGAYLYARNVQTGGTLNTLVVAQGFYNKGDYNFFSYQHHGTPQERVDALTNGYNLVGTRLLAGLNSPIGLVSTQAIAYMATIQP